MNCCRQIPGQAGVAKQHKIDKANRNKTFAQLFAESKRRQLARKRAAGVHKCKWVKSGDIRQVTSGDRILKRPRVIAQFYECKLCGETKMVKL